MTSPDSPKSSFSAIHFLNNWGNSSVPPAGLASLVLALHARPPQYLPLFFVPALFSATYVNLAGYPTDAAALTCSWSGLYALLALRRRPQRNRPGGARFSARGGVRAAAIALGAVNCVAGGWSWVWGSREADEQERIETNRWGGQQEGKRSGD